MKNVKPQWRIEQEAKEEEERREREEEERINKMIADEDAMAADSQGEEQLPPFDAPDAPDGPAGIIENVDPLNLSPYFFNSIIRFVSPCSISYIPEKLLINRYSFLVYL